MTDVVDESDFIDDITPEEFRSKLKEKYGDVAEAFQVFVDPKSGEEISRSSFKEGLKKMGLVLSEKARKKIRKLIDDQDNKRISQQVGSQS